MKDGIVIINKGQGVTSQRAVSAVKRLFGADKAGHTGTLDPMATGVLPVMLGRASKASEFIMDGRKHYLATMRLGIETDTEDIWGSTLLSSDAIPDGDAVMSVINSFVGKIMQVPPMYSAIKVGGKKLVDLAREGVSVERKPREISIYSIEAKRLSDTDYSLDIVCSKGTYIRTVCADIGRRLGCYATMTSLCRMESGGFDILRAHTIEELESMTDEERGAQLISVEEVFAKYRRVKLPPFFARLARNGLEIYLRKLGENHELGERLRLYDSEGFFALGEVMSFSDGLAIKPIRQFGGAK